MKDQESNSQDWLLVKSQVAEQGFTSDAPLIGSLAAWFRTKWNNVAARWYLQPILRQQNEFNRLAVERMRDIEKYTYDIVSEQDRDLSRLQHDLAALRLQLSDLNRTLVELTGCLQEPDQGERPATDENGDRD